MHTHSQPPPSIPPYGHTQFPSYAPVAGAVLPPNPHRPARSNLGLILGIAGGSLLVLAAAGGAGAYAFLRKAHPVALPVDTALLPAQTNEVATQLIEATRETDPAIRRAYLAAELGSELCHAGAGDPARRIEQLGARSPREAKALLFDAKQREEIAQLLECGSVLGGKLESPYQAAISFDDDGGKTHRVGVGHVALSGAPRGQGFLPQAYRGISGFCRTGERDGTCDDSDYGAFPHGQTWFFGRKTALDALAPNVRKPKEKLGQRVEAMKEAAAQTEGLPVVRIQANPKSSKELFGTPCLYGAVHTAVPLGKFLEGCFPAKAIDRTLEEIDSKIKAAAYEMDGDHQKAKAFHGNIVLVARDDRGAKDVERDVRDVVTEWSAHVDANEAKLINDARELASSSREKKFGAVIDAYFHALKKAKVTRKGRSVIVSFREAISPEDLSALDEADRSTQAKRVATASILDALQARKPVPEAQLAVLVGPSWGHFLASPPASLARSPMSESECRTLQQRTALFSLSDRNFTSEARSMLVSHRFASCSTHPPDTDLAQRACLASFRTAAEYARCASIGASTAEPPESEFGDRAKR